MQEDFKRGTDYIPELTVGPVLLDGVVPVLLIQSNLSFFDCVHLHKSLSKLQFKPSRTEKKTNTLNTFCLMGNRPFGWLFKGVDPLALGLLALSGLFQHRQDI